MQLELNVSVEYEKAGVPAPKTPAKLTCFLLPASEGLPEQMEKPIVIVCPGGGYAYKSVREAEPIAMKFLAAGMHAAVLQYSTEPSRYPTAALELAWAVQQCRRNAAQWHVRPDCVYVAGFSAGGHLACTLGTTWEDAVYADVLGADVSVRPDAQVLGYPVVTLGEFAHVGSRVNLLGEDASEEDIWALSLENRVNEHTVPTFLWHTLADASVPVENSLQYACALRRAGVPFELHLYEQGSHGLATCDAITATKPEQIVPDNAGWIDLAIRFLRRRSA